MANKIQIKRSTSNATVTGLSNGELAFTQASNTLYIGLPDGSGVLRVGGAQYPGTLTANHALVANSTSGIDKVIVANAVITSLVANGSAGSNGQVLVVNSSGGVYWGTGTSGSNTYVQFNDSGVANGVAGFTFVKTSNTLAIGNTITTNNLFGTTVNAASHTVGTDVVANSIGVFATGTVNGATISVGSNFKANVTQVTIGTGVGLSVNGSLGTANQVLRTNGSSTYWADDVGDISSITAGDGLNGGGSVGDITIDVGAGIGISVNATAVSVLPNNGIIANTTGTYVDPANGVYVDASGVGVLANNGIVSNTSGTWAKAANGISVDSSGINVVGNTGVTVNATGVFIGQPVATTSNVTFANVVTTDLSVNGNTTLGDATSDKVTFNARIDTAIIPTTNNSYDLGSNSLRWANIYVNHISTTDGASFGSNVSVAGTLTVTGNLVTQNVQSVIVSDPMIYLAGNNYSSDLVDIGFAANYNDGANRHTGLFRDHTDGLWKLFFNLEQELSGNNDVDTNDASYRTATLVAYLASGALTTNTTSANLTANSTYSVGIVANTLTLATALAGTSGGTGKATVTNNALLVGNSTNGYNELTLGTSGYVLQSNGTALVYDILDGGSF
jgi:hypothetical protein